MVLAASKGEGQGQRTTQKAKRKTQMAKPRQVQRGGWQQVRARNKGKEQLKRQSAKRKWQSHGRYSVAIGSK
jgi:hypothetical protein